jgi:hypothetical protein
LGIGLVLAGLLGFLPVLGFWMIPLGLSLLAVDFPSVRRLIQRLRTAFAIQRGTARDRPAEGKDRPEEDR